MQEASAGLCTGRANFGGVLHLRIPIRNSTRNYLSLATISSQAVNLSNTHTLHDNVSLYATPRNASNVDAGTNPDD